VRDGLYMPKLGAFQMPGSFAIPGTPQLPPPAPPGGTVVAPPPSQRTRPIPTGHPRICATLVIYPSTRVWVTITGTGPTAKVLVSLYKPGGPMLLIPGAKTYFLLDTWADFAANNDPEIMMGLWFAAAHPEGVTVQQTVVVSNCTDLRGGGWRGDRPANFEWSGPSWRPASQVVNACQSAIADAANWQFRICVFFEQECTDPLTPGMQAAASPNFPDYIEWYVGEHLHRLQAFYQGQEVDPNMGLDALRAIRRCLYGPPHPLCPQGQVFNQQLKRCVPTGMLSPKGY
jgi:hypothetical protein